MGGETDWRRRRQTGGARQLRRLKDVLHRILYTFYGIATENSMIGDSLKLSSPAVTISGIRNCFACF